MLIMKHVYFIQKPWDLFRAHSDICVCQHTCFVLGYSYEVSFVALNTMNYKPILAYDRTQHLLIEVQLIKTGWLKKKACLQPLQYKYRLSTELSYDSRNCTTESKFDAIDSEWPVHFFDFNNRMYLIYPVLI